MPLLLNTTNAHRL